MIKPEVGGLHRGVDGDSAAISDVEVLSTALSWLASGRRVALATVVRSWGSSPRPAGSQCAVSDNQELVGSVSGGCVEGAVIQAAQQVMQSGKPEILDFAVADEQAWSVGLACGGQVQILIEAVVRAAPSEKAIAGLVRQLSGGGAAVAVTPLLSAGSTVLTLGEGGLNGGDALTEAVRVAAIAALDADRSTILETDDGSLFLRAYNPPPLLILIGAVHIAQPLSQMATTAGFDVIVVDPREVFANPKRFPGVRVLRAWPEEALASLGLDPRTALVSLSHDPKLDDPALSVALASPAYYIGALGSRRTHEKRTARLSVAGFTEKEISRIAAPVGLDIGARSPSEIAVAILAQVIAALRTPGAGTPAR